jgi:hypothetical protein
MTPGETFLLRLPQGTPPAAREGMLGIMLRSRRAEVIVHAAAGQERRRQGNCNEKRGSVHGPGFQHDVTSFGKPGRRRPRRCEFV